MTVRAKKHLGQHFLKDEDIAKKIANSLTGNGYDNILEIGPGMGVLTKYLLEKKSKVTVMEIDKESVDYLNDDFKKERIHLDTSPAKFQIIEADFLKQNLSIFFKNQQVASTSRVHNSGQQVRSTQVGSMSDLRADETPQN